MKFLQKLSGAALLSAALLFTACDKDKEIEKVSPAPLPAVSKLCNLSREIDKDNNTDKVYEYDAQNRIIKISLAFQGDSVLSPYKSYTYNAQGKAAEEIYYDPDGTVRGKQLFTYNNLSQLIRIDFQGMSTDSYNPSTDHIIIHYNAAGKRIKAEFYEYTNPNVLAYYYVYTYNQNKIFAAEHDATTTPATLMRTIEYHFDNKKSANHALGYLNGIIPDMEKHNVIYYNWPATTREPSNAYSYISYQYDSLDYPISEVRYPNMGWGPYYATYEYNCQ